MPRIRTIKPDAFTSDTLSSVSVLARWTFAGLWTYCDDAGRARRDARLVKAALFPIDDGTTLDDIEGVIDELVSIGSLCEYEVEGKAYMHCPTWDDHQRVSHPSPSKIPGCPEHSGTAPESLESPPESLGRAPESLGPEGKGIEKEQGTSTDAARRRNHDAKFADFWAAYPRRVDKGHAQKAWAKLGKDGVDPQTVIAAAAAFAAKSAQSDPKFIPHAATWLNGERWLDEEPTPQPDAGARVTFSIPEPPPHIADDPAAYQQWVREKRAEWDARQLVGSIR